jgi:hypothetical protein
MFIFKAFDRQRHIERAALEVFPLYETYLGTHLQRAKRKDASLSTFRASLREKTFQDKVQDQYTEITVQEPSKKMRMTGKKVVQQFDPQNNPARAQDAMLKGIYITDYKGVKNVLMVRKKPSPFGIKCTTIAPKRVIQEHIQTLWSVLQGLSPTFDRFLVENRATYELSQKERPKSSPPSKKARQKIPRKKELCEFLRKILRYMHTKKVQNRNWYAELPP